MDKKVLLRFISNSRGAQITEIAYLKNSYILLLWKNIRWKKIQILIHFHFYVLIISILLQNWSRWDIRMLFLSSSLRQGLIYVLWHNVLRLQYNCLAKLFVSINLIEYDYSLMVKVSGLWTADPDLKPACGFYSYIT